MRVRIVIIIVAVVLGAAAAVLAVNYVRSARTDVASQSQPVEVLVAQQDLPRGVSAEELVAQGLVKIEEVPARFVAADAVSSERVIADQVLASAVGAGEQLTKSRFSYPADAGLSYTVPEGYVAVSVAVDEVGGVAGLLKPGDSVAVFASFEPMGRPSAFTKTNVGKARVLAVGEQTSAETPADAGEQDNGSVLAGDGSNAEEKTYRTVTLALTLKQAQEAAFGTEFGIIQLALLPQGAEEPTLPAGVGFKQVAPKQIYSSK